MASAEALRKLQAEAAAQPEKQALRDVAMDNYEKQLLSEVGWAAPRRAALLCRRCGGGGPPPDACSQA